MTAACKHCGKPYTTYPVLLRRGLRSCSRACSMAAAREFATCQGCGAWFVKKKVETDTYCTSQCFNHRNIRTEPADLIRANSVVRDDGCWVWTGTIHRPKSMQAKIRDWKGYGLVRVHPRTSLAHRFSYETFIGPIPVGLEVDHLCFNTLCVNPDHLEAVSRSENSRRYMVNKHWPERRAKEMASCVR